MKKKVAINCSYMMPVELLREPDFTKIIVEFEGQTSTQVLYDIDWRKVDNWEKE